MLNSFQFQTRLESTLDFGLWTLDFFYRLRMTQGYQLGHSLSQRLLKHFFDNVLLEHVELHWVGGVGVGGPRDFRDSQESNLVSDLRIGLGLGN